MSNLEQKFRIPPVRSVREFVGGNDWGKPTFNPNEFGELQKHVIANLIYYQSNYGIIAILFLLLVAFFRPAALILGLVVLGGLLAAFVYSSKHHTQLTVVVHDRPIIVLVILLVLSYVVIRMFGTVFIFLLGIALPLALIIAHATARIPTIKIKAEMAVENLSLQATPMGLLLSWLGAKPAANEPTKRKIKQSLVCFSIKSFDRTV